MRPNGRAGPVPSRSARCRRQRCRRDPASPRPPFRAATTGSLENSTSSPAASPKNVFRCSTRAEMCERGVTSPKATGGAPASLGVLLRPGAERAWGALTVDWSLSSTDMRRDLISSLFCCCEPLRSSSTWSRRTLRHPSMPDCSTPRAHGECSRSASTTAPRTPTCAACWYLQARPRSVRHRSVGRAAGRGRDEAADHRRGAVLGVGASVGWRSGPNH